jgi:hypothetical protein
LLWHRCSQWVCCHTRERRNNTLCRYEKLGAAAHTVKLVLNYLTKRVGVVSWDTKPEKETSTRLNVKSRCAASGNEKSKLVPIALITRLVEQYKSFIAKADINTRNTNRQSNLFGKMAMRNL